MHRRLALVVLLTLAGWAAPSGQEPPARAAAVEDEILVRFRPEADEGRRAAALSAVNGQRLKRFRQLDIDHVRIPRGRRAAAVVAALRAHPDVLAAQPNFIRRITAPQPPNDFFWVNDVSWNFWGIPRIQAKAVWDTYTVGSPDVIVADIDTGVKYTHPDLAPNMWVNPLEIPGNGIDDDGNGYVDDVHGIDTFNDDSDPMDDHGHGTHTAGTFAAVGNNGPAATTGTALVGVTWNSKILACKFLDAAGNGSDAGAIECFNYITALKNRGENIRVSNNSWGGYRNLAAPFPQLLKDAIDAAGNAGIINVFAAGNGGLDGRGDDIDVMPHDPASFTSPSIVSVAASTSNDGRASFSNFGAVSVDLAAPGVDILSAGVGADLTCVGGTQFQCAYRYSNGTSMAAPHVAGVAALLVAQSPAIPVAGIKSLLISHVTPVGAWSGRLASGGRLNALGAANALSANTPPTVSITSPAGGDPFTAPATVTITATASDSGSVAAVEFFMNAVAIGVDTTAPFTATATNVPAGSYILTARATDNLGSQTTSVPVAIVVDPEPIPAPVITATVVGGGTRLQQLQNADGGWYFRATDTTCGFGADVSCPNIIGVTGLGLLSAYERSGDPAILADAVEAGARLLAIRAAAPAAQPYSQDLEFLVALADASGDPQYATAATAWFSTVTTAHPVAAARVDWQLEARHAQRLRSLAVWDLASLIRSAKAAGEGDYAQALAAEIIAREAEWKDVDPLHRWDQCGAAGGCGPADNPRAFDYTLLGMGSLLWAIHDLPGFDAQVADYRAWLLSQQDAEGTWNVGNLQITAYVALGLGAVGGAGTAAAIQEAVRFFIDHQLPEGGFPFSVVGSVASAEFTTVDSEIVRAIGVLYSTAEGEGVQVAPAQLATLTFEQVTAAGTTAVVAAAAIPPGTKAPNRYTLISGFTYAASTTAAFKGGVVMCLSLPWDTLADDFGSLRLLQVRPSPGQGPARLVDRTILRGPHAPDAAARRLCAAVDSLDPLTVGRR
jgi:subtilisin family serine protease